MSNIWGVLVPEPKLASKIYFAEIMVDLQAHITSKQWRVRESCCNALCDILAGRTWNEIGCFLADIWALTFRVLDDVKESVRQAALATAKKLGRVSINLCKYDQHGAAAA